VLVISLLQRSVPPILAVFFLIGACAENPSSITRSPGTYIIPEKPRAEILGMANVIDNISQDYSTEIGMTKLEENLLGLDDAVITQLFGKPTFERIEPPALIWQYQSSICFVDFFLFHQDEELSVEHVEVRSKNVKKIRKKTCLSSILKVPGHLEGLGRSHLAIKNGAPKK
jgi:hypothetical protein